MTEKDGPTSLKDSVPARTVQILASPLLSYGAYQIHVKSHGRLIPELKQFFGPTEHTEAVMTDMSDILTKIDDEVSAGKNFVRDRYGQWNESRKDLDGLLDVQITDYVLFDPKEGRHIIFAEKDDEIIPIFLPGKAEKEARKQGMIGLGVPHKKNSMPSESVARELVISDIENEVGREGLVLRRVNSVCNDFELRRHSLFEREGSMFDSLREQGAMSIGEIQTVTRLIVQGGISFRNGDVRIDPSLELEWIDARVMSITESKSKSEKTAQAEAELQKFAREVIYYRAVDTYLKENPEAVMEFMKSDKYLAHRKDFMSSHLSAKGRTEEDIARGMIANYLLSKFEGVPIADSPSQKYLKDKAGFSEDVKVFLDENGFTVPSDLGELLGLLNEDIFVKNQVPQDAKAVALADAEKSLSNIRNEMWRHKETRKIFEKILKLSPFDVVDDDEKASKVVRIIIANLGLVRVPGENRFTIGSYLSDVPYYPAGSEVLPFAPEDANYQDVEDSLRYIFNGEIFGGDPGSESAYESQVARIFTEGSTVLKFLSEDPRVPENVRDFIRTIQSDDLSQKILERYGPISDQDPQIVNRFFKDGFDRFQTMTTHRYVTDFVRGVETNLIALTAGRLPTLKRRFVDGWKNYDFSQLPEETFKKAIEMTLADGEHRIKLMNHEISTRTTVKDKQEMLEKMFGWNTYDMWFLRWEKFWNVWNTLGGAWDCMCFMRKPIFNSGTFKQY